MKPTTHLGVKKTHDWSVDQITDIFHTPHKVKTQQVTSSRGQQCGDIELDDYLVNTVYLGVVSGGKHMSPRRWNRDQRNRVIKNSFWILFLS